MSTGRGRRSVSPVYVERASRLAGAVVWINTGPEGGSAPRSVLPDGCMDLLWHEGRLLVAGPDTHAYVPEGAAGRWAGVRFYPGTGPAFLGVPAHELLDLRVDLADLWPARQVRRLAARVAADADPVTALEQVALDRAAAAEPPIRCCGRS